MATEEICPTTGKAANTALCVMQQNPDYLWQGVGDGGEVWLQLIAHQLHSH